MYYNRKTACGTYRKNDLTNLTPLEVVARLHKALGLALGSAQEAAVAGDSGRRGEEAGRALAIVGELRVGLNKEEGGEISANLNDLYLFLTKEITQANISNSAVGFDNAINVVKPLTEAWVELAAKQKEEKAAVASGGVRPVEEISPAPFQARF